MKLNRLNMVHIHLNFNNLLLCLLPFIHTQVESTSIREERSRERLSSAKKNDTVTFLSTNYPEAPACNDSTRIASYDDVFDECVTSCKGKAICKMVIGKQKPVGNIQSQCSEFSSICTSIGSPCTNCPTDVTYAAVCEEKSDFCGSTACASEAKNHCVTGNGNNENSETSTDSGSGNNRNRDRDSGSSNNGNSDHDVGNENNGDSGSDGKDKAGDADSQAMTIHGMTEFATFICVLVYMIN